jgi:hypothetical protein
VVPEAEQQLAVLNASVYPNVSERFHLCPAHGKTVQDAESMESTEQPVEIALEIDVNDRLR